MNEFCIVFSGIWLIRIWVSLWRAERTSRIMWRLKKAVHVIEFLNAVHIFNGVGINFEATDISIIVVRNK